MPKPGKYSPNYFETFENEKFEFDFFLFWTDEIEDGPHCRKENNCICYSNISDLYCPLVYLE